MITVIIKPIKLSFWQVLILGQLVGTARKEKIVNALEYGHLELAAQVFLDWLKEKAGIK